MDCIANNPLSDDQIHELLEGDASPAVESHAEECPFCAQRVQAAAGIMPTLAALLYRAECPSSDELGKYHFGLLNPEARSVVDKHLKVCRHCQHELQEMREFLETEIPLEDLAPTDSPTLDITAPNFLFAQPATGERVALRGGSSLRGVTPEPVMFNAETTTIFLTLVKELNVYNLHGQVKDNENWDLWSEAAVEIWQHGSKIDTIQTDDMGHFDYALNEDGMIDIRVVARDRTSLIINDIEVED